MSTSSVTPPADPLVITSPYQQTVADYWDAERNPVNLRLGEVDGLYHHHYGIGPVREWVDRSDEQQVIVELHRLETAQAALLLDHLGALAPVDRVLDAGCGRGGTSFLAHERFGCQVDGVTISLEQARFATDQAGVRQVDDKVRFHHANMLDTGLPNASVAAGWNNETDMYVDLRDLFREIARVLQPGGRWVFVTGVVNDVTSRPSPAVQRINEHYHVTCHLRSDFFTHLAMTGLVPITVTDLTADTLPYWELRAESSLATGIENAFLAGSRDGSFQYLMIVVDKADHVPPGSYLKHNV